MDAYLRSVGIELETYAVNGERVVPRARDEFEAAVRAMLVAYVRAHREIVRR
jgi:hypothetical protein